MPITTTVQSHANVRDALGNYRERITYWVSTLTVLAKRKEAERSLSYACELLSNALADAGYEPEDLSYVKCDDDYWVIDWRTSTRVKRNSHLPAGLPLVDHIDDLIAI